MKHFVFFTILLSLTVSCSKKIETKKIQTSSDSQITTIKENVSFVSAKILEMNRKSETDYRIKVLILESNSDESLPNFAAVNDEFYAKPNFILDENGNIDANDSRNKNLIELSKVRAGAVVNLTLTRTLNDGWLILNFQKQGEN